MHLLVGWDDENETDLLRMYLEADANVVTYAETPAKFLERFRERPFDAVVFPVTYPDADAALAVFAELQDIDQQAAVLVAARPGEIYPLSRLVRRGLSSHVYRDPDGEYLFLLQTMLESAIEGKRAERERILADRLREEVESVRKLQETIIPKDIDALPGYEIVARYEPSQIRVADGSSVTLAGGDYYDAIRISDETMFLLVGDASGHGMKACMSIMSLHTLINQIRRDARPPHEFVAEINRQLCTTDLIQGEGGFITLLFGLLEQEKLHWCSAGHCLPVLQNVATGECQVLGDPKVDGGPPLAVFDEAEYETVCSPIPPGHRMLIYTDGLEEAFPVEGRHHQFGIKGILETLTREVKSPARAALDRLFADSEAFTQGSGRHDDTSALLLERAAD